jgi:Zn finger protein HypA/HybF involved in hydrogenase expression
VSEFQIPAPELARLTHNALAFMPARSAVKVCRVHQNIGSLSIMATDLFTVGYDSVSVETETETASIDLSREDLQALDKAARAAKKEDVQIQINHEDGMFVWTVEEDEPLSFLDSSAQRQPEDLWERCDELLTRLERAQGDEPPAFYYLALDPALMGRFGKVKPSDGKECIADLHLGHDDQILVKIGSTFRGAIMPVDRSEAAGSEFVGSDGLWSDEKVDS